MNKEYEIRELRILLDIVEGMISGIGLNMSKGICQHLSRGLANKLGCLYISSDTFGSFIEENMREEWYSGNSTYPITDPDNPYDSGVGMFIKAAKKGVLWKGAYGDNRRLVLTQYRGYLEKRLEALTRKSMWQRLKDWLRKT